MRKMIMTIGILTIFAMTATGVHANGLAKLIGGGIAMQAAGSVGEGLGRVAEAGADWAQQEITGYNTYFQSDLDSSSINRVNSVTTQPGAFVTVGSATFHHSRFVGDVDLEMNNNVGRINADQGAYVNVGSIGFQNTRVNGDTDIYTRNRVPGGIDAGQGSTVMIGVFESN